MFIQSLKFKIMRHREHIVVRSVFWFGVIGIVSFAGLSIANVLSGTWPDVVHLVGLIFSLAIAYTAQFADRFSLIFTDEED